MKNTILILFFSMLGTIASITAQNTFSASGGEANDNSGTVSYTIGQVFYSTSTGTNGNTTAQGVQQPYEISTMVGSDEININLGIEVYPNPATDYLVLTIENIERTDLSYKLFDLNGTLILSHEIKGNSTNISLNSLPPAPYFLDITANSHLVKSYKIIKN